MDLTVTKGETPPAGTTFLENGVITTIYAYTKGATVTDESVTSVAHGDYTAGGDGSFSGKSDYTMFLARGPYDFYAVSCNSKSDDVTIPTFTKGTSAGLLNGVDYIYGSAANQTVENSGKTVSLGLSHKAVCIEITVKTKANSGIELVSWEKAAATDNNNATITPPDASGCTMSLADGTIEPATGVSDVPANMTTTAVTGYAGSNNEKTATASYYMLPLVQKDGSNSFELKVTFNVKVKIDGNTYTGGTETTGESKVYTANLTAPSSGYAFEAGKKYTYTAILKPNTITFTGATVTAWGEGVKDAPLTPTEPDIVP